MDQSFATLEAALQEIIDLSEKKDVAATLTALRKAEPGLSGPLLASATRVVDLASQVIQLLEPAHLVLADHLFAYQSTQCLAAAVRLGIADHLSNGPLTLHELALRCDARPDRLRQILRWLSNNAIFSCDLSSETFANTEASTLLQRNHPSQWFRWASVCGTDFYEMARGLPASMGRTTHRSPAQTHYDTDESMFAYLEQHGIMPRLRECMGAAAIAQTPSMIAGYPWTELEGNTLLDLGGGDGSLIAALLRQYPTLRGGVFETSRVMGDLQAAFHSTDGKFADVGSRTEIFEGDFMLTVPAMHAYVMRWCLHDWDDEHALQILRNIRRAIVPGPGSRLVLLELVLANGRMGRMSRMGDINVLVTAEHGQERSERDWEKLATASGWEVKSISPLPGAWPSVIDMRPIDQPNARNE